jgi:glycosyltransferase involved in cell wall biosynthesis
MPRTVLLLAYHFPPLGGPTAQRAISLVTHLPSVGYEPIVVTGAPHLEDHWSPFDAAGELALRDGLVIERLDVSRAGSRRHRVERLLAIPSAYGRRFGKDASKRVASLAGRVDVVLGEFGPYDLTGATRRVARSLGVPWVADFQDPWALDEMWLYPTLLHRLVDRRRMGLVLADADAVIMNTKEAVSRVRATFPKLDGGRLFAIPNGFDKGDFADPPEQRNDRFRIVHTGTLHTRQGIRTRAGTIRAALGGMPVPGVDFATRSPTHLLEAVDRLLARDPTARAELEVVFVGPTTAEDRTVIESSSVSRWVGIRSHAETVAAIKSADLLFLPMQNLPPGMRAGLVPTKTYEYAASGRQILAAVPPGDARDLLEGLATATLVSPEDVAGMERALREMLDRWRRGYPAPVVDTEVLAEFEYGAIVDRVARVLDLVVKD